MGNSINTRICSWLILLLSILSSTRGQGFFVHSVMVDGKPKMVTTRLNSGSILHGSPPPRKPTTVPLSAKFEIPLTPADQQWLGSLLYIPDKTDKRLRKEYRELTQTERERLHFAFNLLKNDTSVTFNKYDLLADIHARSSANANAHGGPNFLGWHRVFLLMMENALREKVRNVTLPYWDVTLDEAMEKPYNSIIWSGDFIGGGDGPIKTGSFGHWETHFGYGHLKRLLAARGKLMSKTNVENILSKRHLGDISNPGADIKFNIEEIHNDVHVWIGGQMRTIEIAAFDPIFYLLHTFTDNIWTEFREQQKTDGIDPTSDYPEYYGGSFHSPFAPMALGQIMVIDGLSDIWNENVRYTPRPTCNRTFNGCNSPFLKCDKENERCISKSIEEVQNDNVIHSVRKSKQTDIFEQKSLVYVSAKNETEVKLENMYMEKTFLVKVTSSSNILYVNFQNVNSNSNNKSVHEVVKTSEAYQFYSDLSNHTDMTNLILFDIYLRLYHFRDEYR